MKKQLILVPLITILTTLISVSAMASQNWCLPETFSNLSYDLSRKSISLAVPDVRLTDKMICGQISKVYQVSYYLNKLVVGHSFSDCVSKAQVSELMDLSAEILNSYDCNQSKICDSEQDMTEADRVLFQNEMVQIRKKAEKIFTIVNDIH